MKFDSEGNLILPQSVMREKSDEDNGIILNKVQVSEINPAIAQLKIKLGKNIAHHKELIRGIKEQCENYVKYKQASSEIKLESTEETITVQAQGSYDMYSYLKELIMNIKNYDRGKRVVIRGSWVRD